MPASTTNKTKISPEEVRHMAQLSRLNLSDSEIHTFTVQISKILDYMTTLQSTDTKDIEPLFTPSTQPEWQRLDKVDNQRTRKEILANAPDTDGEYFIVPKII